MKPTSPLPLIIIALLFSAFASVSAQLIVYQENFETGPSYPEWSTTVTDPNWQNLIKTDVTPIGARRFLGQFGRQTISLALAGLPQHDSVIVEFDLFLIYSWDGDDPDYGDALRLTESSTGYSRCMTLANFTTLLQSYPNVCGSPGVPARSGATETGTLGFAFPGNGNLDAVYHMRIPIAHAGSDLAFNITGDLKERFPQYQNLDNEAWGIDNVTVTLPQPAITLPPDILFAALACAPLTHDTSIWIHSVGMPLRIDGMAVTGADRASFAVLPPTAFPIVIAPNDSVVCTVRFRPQRVGTLSARLEVQSNAANSPAIVHLTGRREVSSVAVAGHTVDFGTLCADGLPRDTSMLLTNITASVTAYQAMAAAPFSILSGAQGSLNGGESRGIGLHFSGSRTAGDYRDTLFIADACGNRDTILLRAHVAAPPHPAMPSSLMLCPGDCRSLDAGIYAAYRWSTGDSTRTISVCDSGRYTVTVVDSLGCAGASDTVIVLLRPAVLRPTVGGRVFLCPGGCDTLDAGAYAGYHWSTGDTTRSIVVCSAGTYSVAVVDSLGCGSVSDTVTVAMRSAPAVTVSATPACICDTVRLAAPPGYASYSWSTGDSTPGIMVVGGTPGPHVVSLSVTDTNGCSSTSTATVVFVVPDARMEVTPAVISGSPGDTVTMWLRVYTPFALKPCSMSGYTAQLRYNRSLLLPLEPNAGVVRDTQFTRLTIAGAWPQAGSDFVPLMFRVMLGDTIATAITLDSISSGTCSVQADTAGGEFRLTGVCTEGGLRLLEATPGAMLKGARPNPTRGLCEIEFRTAERGCTQLVVEDMLGRRVAVLLDEDISVPGPGLIAFDAAGLSSGAYVCRLVTPTETFARFIQVMR